MRHSNAALARKARCLSAMAIAIALTIPTAHAVTWGDELRGTPFERFDKEDKRLFRETARKTLDSGSVNETVSWENPNNKHRGEFTVQEAFKWEGHNCKRVQVRNEADGRKNTSVVNVCQIEGKWRLIASSKIKK
jgi:surface antigen